MKAIFSVSLLLLSLVLLTVTVNESHLSNAKGDTSEIDPSQFGETQSSYPPTNTIPPSTITINKRALERPPEATFPDLFRSEINASLLSVQTDLTYDANPKVTQTFSVMDTPYLGFDGCAWSPGIGVKYELFYPDGSSAYSHDSSWNSPAHFFLSNPPQGNWKVEMTILDRGNTTVWVQAVSPNHGTYYVVSKHKDYIALLPGEAIYFAIPVSDRWFGVNGYGSNALFDLYNPSNVRVHYKSYSVHHLEVSPEPGLWTFIVRNKGETDVLAQVTQPDGVAGSLSPPHSQLSNFRWNQETIYYRIPVGETDWIAIDGAAQSGRVTYEVYSSTFQKQSDYSSYPSDFVHFFYANPQPGDFLLIVFGEKDASLLVQLTQKGNELATLNLPYDEFVSFASAGQAAYFRITMPSSTSWFGLDGATQDKKVYYRLRDPELDDSWSGYSTATSDFLHHMEFKPAIGEWMLNIQGDSSNASFSLRKNGNEYATLLTPYQAFFKFGYNGVSGYYNVSMKDTAWFATDIAIYSSNLRVDLYMYDQALNLIFSESIHYARTHHFFEKTPGYGSWLLVLLGQDQAEMLVSLRQTGEEDATINTPYQEFIVFDYTGANVYYNVSIENSRWFAADFGLQNDHKVNIYFYDPSYDLTISYTVYRTYDPEHWFEKLPSSGNWLVALIGQQTANMSISLSQSKDPREILNIPVYRFENFSFNGQTRFFDINTTGYQAWIGIDLMFTKATTRFYVYDVYGNETWSTYGSQNSVSRKFLDDPEGYLTIEFLSTAGGSTTLNIASSLDKIVDIPYQHTFIFNSTGKTYYLGFKTTSLRGFRINATLKGGESAHIFLYDPARNNQWDTRAHGRLQQYKNPSPQPGVWILVFDAYAGVSLDVSIDILPFEFIMFPIQVAFITPTPSSLVKLDNGNFTILPQYNGTLIVQVNATYREGGYRQMNYVYFSFDGGDHWVEMLFNSSTGLWNYEWNSALAPNGQVTLVAYARQGYDSGIGTIMILVSNPHYTLTLITLDTKGEPIQDAEIYIWHLNGTLESISTNSTGGATFTQLPSGEYPLSIKFMGVTVKETINFQLKTNSHITAWCDVYDLSVRVTSLLLAQPVLGAEVKVHGPDGNQIDSTTNASGLTTFAQLPLHTYKISVQTWLGQATIEVELSRTTQLFLVRLMAPIDLIPFAVSFTTLTIAIYVVRRRRRKRELLRSPARKKEKTRASEPKHGKCQMCGSTTNVRSRDEFKEDHDVLKFFTEFQLKHACQKCIGLRATHFALEKKRGLYDDKIAKLQLKYATGEITTEEYKRQLDKLNRKRASDKRE